MANYLLHNLGDYKSTNFREMVLCTLKNSSNKFLHLRDIPFSNLSIYDYKDWLRDDREYKTQLKKSEEALEKWVNLIADPDDYLKTEYQKYVSKQESLQKAKNSWYKDHAEKINKNAGQYLDYFSTLKRYSKGIIDHFLPELEDAYYTAKAEEVEALTRNKEAIISMNSETILSFDEWAVTEKDRMAGHLRFYKNNIKDAKTCIKKIKEINKEIMEVFEVLNKVDREVENDQNK